MFDFIIGAGQGGSRVAKEFADSFECDAAYFNLSAVDFSKFEAPRNRILVIDKGGTGRNPEFGEGIVRKRFTEPREFLTGLRNFERAQFIMMCVGGGGGSGTGFMFPLLDYMLKRKKEILLVYTLPENREGIPAKPNALVSLNRLIDDYLQRDSVKKISLMPIDNDFCVRRYGHDIEEDGYNYWRRVNLGLVRALKRFWLMTNLEKYKNYIDVASGYKGLDKNDVLRIVFSKHGFMDIREMIFEDTNADQLLQRIKTASLVFGSLDIRTTKRYAISVGIPDEWKSKEGILEFVEQIFDVVSKSTKHTPDVVRSSYFNKKLSRIHVSMLLAGLSKSHGLEKIVKSAVKDVKRLKNKGDVEKLDLSDLMIS